MATEKLDGPLGVIYSAVEALKREIGPVRA